MSAYKKIFFDTNPPIYYLERNPQYLDRMTQFLTEQSDADADFITSTITVGEYLTGPYRKHEYKFISDFREFINVYDFKVVPINWGAAEEAAKIRGTFKGFKLMDALQLSVAKLQGCDAFVTNDRQLLQFDGLEILVVEDMSGTSGAKEKPATSAPKECST